MQFIDRNARETSPLSYHSAAALPQLSVYARLSTQRVIELVCQDRQAMRRLRNFFGGGTVAGVQSGERLTGKFDRLTRPLLKCFLKQTPN